MLFQKCRECGSTLDREGDDAISGYCNLHQESSDNSEGGHDE